MANPQNDEKKKRNKERRRNGSVAWQELTSKSKPKFDRLERAAIARNLYKEIVDRNINVRELESKAGFERYKVLHRLLLPNGVNPEGRELYSYKEKYIQVIKAIQSLTSQDLYTLTDRITFGTSIHPSGVKNRSSEEALYGLLLKWITQLNEKYDLYNRYLAMVKMREEMISENEDLSGISPVPRLAEGGYFNDVCRWTDLIPFIPHVCLGIADQFDHISSYDDERFWPFPSEVIHEIQTFNDQLTSETDSYSVPDQSSKEWVTWHKKYLNILQEHVRYPLKLQAAKPISGNSSNENTEISVQDAETALNEMRRIYMLQVYDDVRARGYEIPDKIFTGKIRDIAWVRPLMHIVMEHCKEHGVSLPYHVHQLYESNEDTSSYCDEYRDVTVSPVWLAICMNSEGNALIPTLIYCEGESAYLHTYPIESPRDLIEMQRFLDFTLALPSNNSCLSQLRESANNQEIKAEWQRTVALLYNHPLHKRYEQDQHIRKLLTEEDAVGTTQASGSSE